MQWRLLFNIGAAHGRTPRHISLILHQPASQPARQTAASERQLTETAHFPAHALHISRRINIFNTYEYCRETERHVGNEIEKEKRDRDRERDGKGGRQRWCTRQLNHCAYLGLHEICNSLAFALSLSPIPRSLRLSLFRDRALCFVPLATLKLFPWLWIRN